MGVLTKIAVAIHLMLCYRLHQQKGYIVIEQKFLEVRHTQMEADAMHSSIERQLTNVKIDVPADYVSVCKEARAETPHPTLCNI